MSMSRRRRNFTIFGGLLIFGAFSYTYYKHITKPKVEKVVKSYTQKQISIILSESIISSNLPIDEILLKTENVVVIIPPDLSIDDIDISSEVSHKVIQSETNDGKWSIIRHLNSEFIFLVKDEVDLSTLNRDLIRGEIIDLEQNFGVINETILSYIIS